MFTAFDGSSWGPLVGFRQLGFEHCIPARRARASLTLTVKSSRILATIKSSNALHNRARRKAFKVTIRNSLAALRLMHLLDIFFSYNTLPLLSYRLNKVYLATSNRYIYSVLPNSTYLYYSL